MERKVAIRNNTRGTFYYAIPNRHVRREVPANGILRVPYDEIEEGIYEKGILQAFKEGKLSIVDKQDAIDLELPNYTPKVVMDERTVLETLTGTDNMKKCEMMRDANPTMKQLIISLIIEHRLSNREIVEYAKEYLNFEVLKTLANLS